MSRTKMTVLIALALILSIASTSIAQEEAETPPTTLEQFQSAQVMIQERDFENALTTLALLREDPQFGAHATYFSGMCLYSLGKYEEAAPFFAASIEVPAFAAAKSQIQAQYAESLFLSKDFEGALSEFSSIEAEGAADAPMLTNIAICHSMNKDDVKAVEYYDKAMVADPNYDDAIWRVGLLLATNKKYEEALPHLENYYGIKPNSMEGREVKKAIIFSYDACFKKALESSEYAKALELLNKLNTFAPNSAEAKEAMESKEAIEEEINK